MMVETCYSCNKVIKQEELIQTDEFKHYGSEVKNYCPSCFLSNVKNGFGNYEIGECHVCKSPLVLQHDDEETISLAQDDYTVHYSCEKVVQAYDRGNDLEIEKLEQEDHGWLILYTIQPDPEEPNFGK